MYSAVCTCTMEPDCIHTDMFSVSAACTIFAIRSHTCCLLLRANKQFMQLRYAEGVRDMLDRYFKGEDFPVHNYIVKEGQLASQYQ